MGRETCTALCLVAVLVLATPATLAECDDTKCCIEKPCCGAEKPGCNAKNCTCVFECSALKSACQCECVTSGTPWNRLTPNLANATLLSSSVGWKVGSETGMNLEQLAVILQNSYNWYVDVDTDVEDVDVAGGAWETTFQSALTSMASDLGVEVNIDSENTTITFSSAD